MIQLPTLTELYNSIITDIESEYGDDIPEFGKNMLRAFAGVQAAKLWLYYKAIGFIQRNIFVDTATSEAAGGTLERFGRVKLGRNRFPAQAGQYTAQVTGIIGATIAASTTFKSNDDSLSPGKLFVLDAQHTLIAATDTITLRALEAGLGARLLVGDQLTATIPIANVAKIAEITAELIEPLAAETLEQFRALTLQSFRLEAQGGAGADYRLWSSDAQGVQQVYPYTTTVNEQLQVNLYVEATTADSTDGKGTPSAALLDDVEEVVEFDPDTTKPLDERGRRPLGAIVNYLPVGVRQIDINIAGFVGLTSSIEALIFSALNETVNNVRPFIDSVDILENRNDILDINKVISTILNAQPGSSFGTVTLEVESSPVTSYQFDNGEIPWLENVTYS